MRVCSLFLLGISGRTGWVLLARVAPNVTATQVPPVVLLLHQFYPQRLGAHFVSMLLRRTALNHHIFVRRQKVFVELVCPLERGEVAAVLISTDIT